METSCKKFAPKASPRPLHNFGKKTQNNHCMQEILLTAIYFERGLSKNLKKVTLFFLLNPFPFNGQNCKKQKEPGTSDHSFFRLQNKLEKFLY